VDPARGFEFCIDWNANGGRELRYPVFVCTRVHELSVNGAQLVSTAVESQILLHNVRVHDLSRYVHLGRFYTFIFGRLGWIFW